MNPAPALRAPGVAARLMTEVAAGLRAAPKTLPSKLLYDEAGARLFERISRLPEYYLTRAELHILRAYGPTMASWLGNDVRIVEFGSGSGDKIRVLLAHLGHCEYVPVDISRKQLMAFARDLARAAPHVRVHPVPADYTHPFELPPPASKTARTVAFFPGSTIGNFHPIEAVVFLRNAARRCGHGGGLLIGVDLRKEKRVIERAYNDAQGVTAAFNLNILKHVNRVCDADFNVAAFDHRAFYNSARHRIEMRLASRAPQHVTLARSARDPLHVNVATGEHIVTEYSYKYDIPEFQALAQLAGFVPVAVWTDARRRFSVHAYDVA